MGIQSLKEFNVACIAKLAMEFLRNKKDWEIFMRGRFYRKGLMITYNRSSSIWKCIKTGLQTVALDISWIGGKKTKMIIVV